MSIRIACALRRGLRIEVAIRSDAERKDEASLYQRKPSPQLGDRPITVMTGNMTFVEPCETTGEVLADTLGVVECPRIGMTVLARQRAAVERNLLSARTARAKIRSGAGNDPRQRIVVLDVWS